MRQYEIDKDAILVFYPPNGVCDDDSQKFQLVDALNGALVAETTATKGAASATGSWTINAESMTISDYTYFTASKPYWVSTGLYGRGYEEKCLDVDPNGSGLNATFTPTQKAKFSVTNGLVRDHGIYYTYAAASNTAVKRNCTAIWRYEISGESFVEYQTVDFVKKPFKINITENDIEQVCATFGITAGNYGIYMNYIGQAINDIYNWLRGQQIYPDLVIEKDLLKNAAIYRILQFRNIANFELSDKYRELYMESLAQFLTSKSWLQGDTEILSSVPESEIALKRIPPKYMLVG